MIISLYDLLMAPQSTKPDRWHFIGGSELAEQMRQSLTEDQDHQIDLATALGMDVPDMSSGPQPPAAPKRRPRQSPAAKRHRD
jgi:hypothetical protein